MSFFDIITMLLALSATFAFINVRFLRLPNEIGVLIMGLGASLFVIILDLAIEKIEIAPNFRETLRQIDFEASLMDGMLAFMLFAGALHVDWAKLRSRAVSVGLLATVGVLISTVIFGFGFWLLAAQVGTSIPLIWCLVFGALISPTDPVAVLSTLRAVNVSEDLEVEMSGEALLNDGVAVVLFTILLAVAVSQEAGQLDLLKAAQLFFIGGLGGAVFGLVTGYIAYRAIRLIDDYTIKVLISLAVVMVTYSSAHRLGLSGPIAVVCAGLLFGERGPGAMRETTRRDLFGFWTLIDALLNIVLFLLIGLEVLVIRPGQGLTVVALLAIPLVLLARLVSVAAPLTALSLRMTFAKGTILVLTWGGLRGGISLALVLAMPEFPQKSTVLAATYAIVIFSMVVQALTLGPLVRRFTA
jgi:CPA1 family monovalent cation:H+ antiporter